MSATLSGPAPPVHRIAWHDVLFPAGTRRAQSTDTVSPVTDVGWNRSARCVPVQFPLPAGTPGLDTSRLMKYTPVPPKIASLKWEVAELSKILLGQVTTCA